MAKDRLEKYIEISEVIKVGKSSRRTNIYAVTNKRTSVTVGYIKWYGGWRKYVFFVEPDMIFDYECLRLIADYTEKLTKQHYANNKLRK